ncbi:hypothetical protein LRS06_00890 [Hymenobacter sp. J193]|uniref:hypothetical protein n=1 Tax=Hymenobacter sp. J193 TaxID=2898429 RepID=UPI002151EB4B|nr:hypothetical protein [Hymenobacter sp. J193]MCR5886349.1 hypothetical protein [Hymenobacter sp. J193]
MKLSRWLLCMMGVLLPALAALATDPASGWLPDTPLSSLMLRNLASAPNGLLWVGTDDGAYRYDGTRLVALNALRRGGVALPTVPCNELLALPDGQLWLGTEAGLFRFRPNGVLESLPLPHPTGGNRSIGALALAADGRHVWVAQNQGACSSTIWRAGPWGGCGNAAPAWVKSGRPPTARCGSPATIACGSCTPPAACWGPGSTPPRRGWYTRCTTPPGNPGC